MKLSMAADWHGKVNRALASASGAKVTCCSLVYSVSIHKSVTVYTKDQKTVRQSHMASKLDLIAFFCSNVVWENGLGKYFSMEGEASMVVGG